MQETVDPLSCNEVRKNSTIRSIEYNGSYTVRKIYFTTDEAAHDGHQRTTYPTTYNAQEFHWEPSPNGSDRKHYLLYAQIAHRQTLKHTLLIDSKTVMHRWCV